MDILVVGNADSQAEFKSKFGSKHSISFKTSLELVSKDITSAEVIFDFDITDTSSQAQLYHQNTQAVLLVNSVKTTVLALSKHFGWQHSIIGFNGLPGMFNRPLLELTLHNTDQAIIKELCHQLETGFRIVDDRVGMITPRVICMIINEAFYTVQEGTANQQDIDMAMKLGTSYPAGPFEMLQTVGVKNVYELLSAIQQDTGDERYKICPLLKRLYLLES